MEDSGQFADLWAFYAEFYLDERDVGSKWFVVKGDIEEIVEF